MNILARYRNFFHGLRKSPSYEVTVMANIASRDLRSTTGSNLRFVQDASGLDPWACSALQLKEGLEQKEQVAVPMQDMWRTKYLATLLAHRQELNYIGATEKRDNLREGFNKKKQKKLWNFPNLAGWGHFGEAIFH